MQAKETMENRRILFNVSSRSRPHKLVEVLAYITALCESDNYNIVVKVDDDDETFTGQYKQAIKTLCPFVCFRYGLSTSKIHAINRDIPNEGWDILVDVSDDFVFTVKGFDNIIRKHCGPDDFVLFPEQYAASQAKKGRNEQIAIMQVMGRDYYKRDGHVFNPSFKSVFCDNFATNVAKLRGRLKRVPDNIFYHAHPTAGFGHKDEQYLREKTFWNEDKKTYTELMRRIKEFV